MTESDNGWDQRILCSDGNCIGIVGADGRCKVCGLHDDGELPNPVTGSDPVDDGTNDPAAEHQMMAQNDVVDDDPAVGANASDDAWETRTLCIDESCIGVVGSDGCCKACGKPYSG